MQTKSTSHSASSNLIVLIPLVLLSCGVLLAQVGFGRATAGSAARKGPSWASARKADKIQFMLSSSVQEEWVARYNGPANGDDSAAAIAIDSSDDVYVTGHSAGSGTGLDYATIKYDSSGNQQWV